MSKEQSIYLVVLMLGSIVYGSFGATWAFHQNGLGTRVYSALLILGCLCGFVYCWVSADLNKKKWVFCHYRIIDLAESIFLTVADIIFLIIYFKLGYSLIVTDEEMNSVLWFFLVYSVFWRIFWTILTAVIPGVGDVFEQSLYKNQIDYQNHTNAEGFVSSLGAIIGAGVSFLVGDFFKYRPWITLCLFAWDWISLWSRWQFYFKKENYSIIKRNFAKDCGEQRRRDKND